MSRSLAEIRLDRATGAAVGLDEDAAARAAGERLEPERAGAGEKVERGRVVDRPEQVEGRLADAVAGRSGGDALRRVDPVALPRAGDDPHARSLES